MARPPKFTTETVKKLLDAIRIGASYESACRYAGIEYATFCNWRNGKLPRKTTAALKLEFFEGLTHAIGEADVQDLAAIRSAAKSGDWRAAAWGLERRHPGEYGKREDVTVTHGGMVKHAHHDMSAFPDDEMDRLAEIAEQHKHRSLS